MLELPEVIQLLKSFERDNSCELTLKGWLGDRGGRIDLLWQVEAWDTDPTDPEAKRLALASVGCLEKRLVRMEDVLLNLLYALDFQFAEQEFISASSK